MLNNASVFAYLKQGHELRRSTGTPGPIGQVTQVYRVYSPRGPGGHIGWYRYPGDPVVVMGYRQGLVVRTGYCRIHAWGWADTVKSTQEII